jgi:hypothetical protein
MTDTVLPRLTAANQAGLNRCGNSFTVETEFRGRPITQGLRSRQRCRKAMEALALRLGRMGATPHRQFVEHQDRSYHGGVVHGPFLMVPNDSSL